MLIHGGSIIRSVTQAFTHFGVRGLGCTSGVQRLCLAWKGGSTRWFAFLGLNPRWVHLAGGNQQNPGNHLQSGSVQEVDSCIPGASEGGQMELAFSLGGNPPSQGRRAASVGERRSLLSRRVERKDE